MNSRGFSLIEICTALVVVGLASAAFMDVIHMLSVSVALGNQQSAVTDLLDTVAETLTSSDTNCSSNLGGIAFDPTIPGGTVVNQLDRYDLNGVKQQQILAIGGALGHSNLIVQDMRLLPVAALSANIIVAKLQISFRRNGTDGLPTILREIPIFTYLNAGQIIYCSPTASNKYTMNNKLCGLLADGYSYYDFVNDACVNDPRVVWITSPDKLTATCPAGSKIAGSATDPDVTDVACYSSTTGIPVTPRQYTNGTGSSGVVYQVTITIDWPTNSCRFVYGAGVNLTTALAQVKCVPSTARPL